MNERTISSITSVIRVLLLAALVLATAGVAAADHYPRVPKTVARKDKAIVEGLRRLTYAESWTMDLVPGQCACLEPSCDDPSHFMVGCGGDVVPNELGLLQAVRRTSRETCLVCGCGADYVQLRATPVCIGF